MLLSLKKSFDFQRKAVLTTLALNQCLAALSWQSCLGGRGPSQDACLGQSAELRRTCWKHPVPQSKKQCVHFGGGTPLTLQVPWSRTVHTASAGCTLPSSPSEGGIAGRSWQTHASAVWVLMIVVTDTHTLISTQVASVPPHQPVTLHTSESMSCGWKECDTSGTLSQQGPRHVAMQSC